MIAVMRSSLGVIRFVVLLGGGAVSLESGCGGLNVAGGKDAGQFVDVPISSGGTAGSGGSRGTGDGGAGQAGTSGVAAGGSNGRASGGAAGSGDASTHVTGQDGGASSPPNVVIILADDLGFGDMGAYGAGNTRVMSATLSSSHL